MDDAAARDRRPAPDSHSESRESASQRPAASPAAAAARRPEPAQRTEPASAQAAPQAPAPSSPERQAPPATAPAKAGGDVEVLRRAWPEVLQTLAKIKRSTWALVEPNAQVGQFDGQILTLVFTTSGLAGAFGRADHSENLRQAIHKTIGIDCQITAVAGAGSSASSEPNPKALTSQDIPATTTDADWGLAPTPGGSGRSGSGQADPSAARPPVTVAAAADPVAAGTVAPPVSSGAPAAGHASPSAPEAPEVSTPTWSGPTITGSRPDTAAPAASVGGVQGAGGAFGDAPPASSDQPTPQPTATQPMASQAPAPQPAAPASASVQAAARGPEQQAGDYSYPDDDWGPPRDEDAPPLDEEPPMDWEPSRQSQARSAPSPAPAARPAVKSAPPAPQSVRDS